MTAKPALHAAPERWSLSLARSLSGEGFTNRRSPRLECLSAEVNGRCLGMGRAEDTFFLGFLCKQRRDSDISEILSVPCVLSLLKAEVVCRHRITYVPCF